MDPMIIVFLLVIVVIAWNAFVQGMRLYLRRKERQRNERDRMNALKNSIATENYFRRY